MKQHRFSRLAPVLLTLLIVTISGSAQADDRHHGRNTYDNDRGHRTNWNRSHNDRNFDRSFNRNFDHGYRNNRNDNRYRRNHDNWSVSLNVGSWYSGSSIYYGTGYSSFGYGVSTRPYFYSPYRTRTVYVNNPTVVYVDDARPVTRVIRSEPLPAHGTSLLRDINGDCFERSYDNQGNEIRVQLPDASCQF